MFSFRNDHYLVYSVIKFNGAVEKGHNMFKTICKMKNINEGAFLGDVLTFVGSKC